MESSRRNPFTSAAVLLLVVCMATEMTMLVQADDEQCYFVSNHGYDGWCWRSAQCRDQCLTESPRNTGGECRGWVPSRCCCRKPCPSNAEGTAQGECTS
ncbi:hypothetical protein BS78_05G178500 [Paspalum vaginatum]|uniref:Knottin scorpion toxin-like domain-containing protein n=1 Tax=Paspalum vaginatum TaxID=158149 RepID=A0A9W8CDZ9_9POAL|nr:hypothetical protein BS78_K150200 [Paspalum vaginatum]KAJ1275977.1 hypothetical protein BS78_05G178500 [Paspalum vaginatum]